MTPVKKLIDYISNNFDCVFPKDSAKIMNEFLEAEKQMVIDAVKFGNEQPLAASGKKLGEYYYNDVI